MASAAPAASPEDELKAALVLGIARFAEWPQPAWASAPLRIGVLGRSEFVQLLEQTTSGRTAAGGRRLEVKSIRNPADLADCQILYFAATSARDIKALLGVARDNAVITIGDSDQFLDWGGAVHVFEEDGRISFEVRLDVLEHAGVGISAKLLKLGHVVRPRQSQP